jgi:hypothetical protein
VVRVDERLFCTQISSMFSLNDEEIAVIKTVLDKKGNILRKSSSGLWESVIGLEVHAQINAKTKMFSSALMNTIVQLIPTCHIVMSQFLALYQFLIGKHIIGY